jgi:hypothetical protein
VWLSFGVVDFNVPRNRAALQWMVNASEFPITQAEAEAIAGGAL